MKDSADTKVIFLEIISSYSFICSPIYGDVYIKHSSKLELLNFEREYLRTLEQAKSKGVPIRLDREKQIIQEGMWTSKQESEIQDNKRMIDGMREQISHSFLHSKRKLFRKEMAGAEQRLNELLLKKDYLIGQTAEKLANKQSTYFQIINSIYTDDKFQNKLVRDELDSKQYEELCDLYFTRINRINTDTIKSIALSSFFTSMYYMCDENAYFFYGKPLVQLTDYQINLLMYGKYFKNLMSRYGDSLPPEMSETPDDMIEWFEITQNVEKSGILNDSQEGDKSSTSIVGATKEDMTLMGINPAQIANIGDDMRKSGKSVLNREDLFNMS